MDKKVLLQLLNHRVKEINNLLEALEKANGISDIENDILLSKIRLLYEDVKLLSHVKSTSGQSAKQKQASPESPASPPPQAPLFSEEVAQPEPVFPQEINDTKETDLPPEPVEHLKPIVADEPEPEPEPKPVPEPKPQAQPEPNIQMDKDQVTQELSNGNILTGVNMEAVDDIMVAIGLNDRFLFTRELFDNDAEMFERTITNLNKMKSWNEANSYLNENFSWNSEDPSLILFISFVKRRYI